jgi:hypothetical protein
MKTVYTNPGFIYIILAIFLCSVYYGILLANGGVNKNEMSVMSCWCICSILCLAIILGIKKAQDDNLTTSKHIIIMYSILIGSLISSSCLIYISDL